MFKLLFTVLCYTLLYKAQMSKTQTSSITQKNSKIKGHVTNRRLRMNLLDHASACTDRKCKSMDCAKMKAILRHKLLCKSTGECTGRG